MRIITYNIHKAIGGVDRRYDPDRVIEVIRHLDPDIALLQEVDDGVPRSRLDRQVDLIAEGTNLEYRAFQRNVQLKRGFYGNAILSRYPLRQAEDLDLTVPMKKRRQALIAACEVEGSEGPVSLTIANVHLGLARFERRRQLRKLIGHARIAGGTNDRCVIVSGDFNDVYGKLGQGELEPHGFICAAGSFKTFPAAFPMRPLDRIYVRGAITPVHSYACHTNVAREASDHLPLVADFESTGSR